METLAVRLLGDFDVDGIDLNLAGSRKARTLLWLLALGRGTSVPVDAVVDGLWSHTPPREPTDQVAVLVSRLRAVVGRDRIIHGDHGYRLAYDWMDVDELESVANEIGRRQSQDDVLGAAAAARVALSLLRPGSPHSEPPGTWAHGQSAALDRLVARSRQAAASALLAAGSWLDASDAAATSLTADAYDETSLRLLMRALVAGGRSAAALAAYASSAQRLADDLGTDPSPETAALHAAILRGELASAAALIPPGLSAMPRLIGRTAELARLDEAADRARRGEVQVVVVTGEAGIGKSSLARSWAAAHDRQDIVLFGRCGQLGGTAPLDPLLVPLRDRLRTMNDDQRSQVLGADAGLLGPLLGLTPASTAPALLADGIVGPTLLFAALTGAVVRLAQSDLVILVLDDAHRGGPALAQWLEYVRHRAVPMLVVATVRTPEPAPVAGTEVMNLGPLDPAHARELVGDERADLLYARSGGHPLFLTELARAPEHDDLPESLVEAVSLRCAGLGRAGETLRTAAVVGDRVDPELLATVLNRPAVEILDDAEAGVRHSLLTDDSGVFRFRHSLVREALSARAGAARSAWLHRQVARVLARRPGSDPAEVADHARRGGDADLAAVSLRAAAMQAEERFDHATAESLLDQAIALRRLPELWLDRARVRTRVGDYAAAYQDVELAAPLGSRALEVGAWASYFDRRFDQATAFAMDGAAIADTDEDRARCLTVAGRTRHAAGDLARAEELLIHGIDGSRGYDRMIASAWLGVLRSHQSRPDDALTLLRPVARSHAGAEHSSAVLHALLFSGHAHALAGRPALSLESFERCDTEVERRQVMRFAGRGTNFAGWVLRNLGAHAEAADHHREAWEIARARGTPELLVAALEDLAEDRLEADDLPTAESHLDAAAAALRGDLVFGWRLRFKLASLRARLALAGGDADQALAVSSGLADGAGAVGVPRYAAVARLLMSGARAALGETVDLDDVERDLASAQRAVAIEAWWWAGQAAAAHRVPAWVDRAAEQVEVLAREAGPRGDVLRRAAAPRLDAWLAAAS